jgi:ABC-type multidrug transport system ATPase subunit
MSYEPIEASPLMIAFLSCSGETGKTTTISMLTGMIEPTEGYATVAGKDIRTDMDSIREDIGICLQHDCLFPELTVKEHIEFFARVKGMYAKMSNQEAAEKVDTSISDVALSEKRNTLSKSLSGGMKRKLSVAIAFCGDSKTVLLDEPTSGMDPFSRRFTWNVIRQYRQDRCIILTTHFMVSSIVTTYWIGRFSRQGLILLFSPILNRTRQIYLEIGSPSCRRGS